MWLVVLGRLVTNPPIAVVSDLGATVLPPLKQVLQYVQSGPPVAGRLSPVDLLCITLPATFVMCSGEMMFSLRTV